MNVKLISSIGIFLWMTAFAIALTPTEAIGQSSRKPRRLLPRNTESTQPADENRCSPPVDSEWFTQERIIFLTGEITAEKAEQVIAQLLYLEAQAPGKDIFLYINSEGGEITAGLGVYDVMRSLQSSVVTVTLGEASSMASILLAGGTKGKRFALPNARLLIHQPLGGYGGQASDIAIGAKEILYHKSKLNRMLAEMTGQSLKRIEADTDRDFFLSAEEAKAYGLVDAVVKRLPSASNPTGQ